MLTGKTVAKNVIISISAQAVSLLVSFLLNLIVPKFISELDYAYWQTFVLYIGYSGIFHFGILDGIVLRYGGFDYEKLDKPRMRSQCVLLMLLNTVVMLFIMCIAVAFMKGAYRYIGICVAIGIVTKNLFLYTSYILQITNRINRYAQITIIQRGFFGVVVVALLVAGIKEFYWYCIADLLGDTVGIIVGSRYIKGVFLGKIVSITDALKELWINLSSGIKLLLANWSAMFLIGSAKMIVQWHWDELTFGKVSLAFSISSLFLSFVTAISIVLFPTIKRMNPEKMPKLYKGIRGILSPTLFMVMLCYFPGCFILEMWLPKYSLSLGYLGILLPIIVYSSKVSLLTNNYLKVYRKEQAMLWINIISVVLAFVSFVISAYVFDNMKAVLVCVVVAIMLRSVVSELVVMKAIGQRIVADFIIEALMTVAFIICASIDSLWTGCLVYFIILLLYIVHNKNNLCRIIKQLMKQ